MKFGSNLILVAAAVLSISTAGAQTSTVRSRSGLSLGKSERLGLNSADKTFMKEAALANMAEVKLGQLARQNGGAWGRAYGSDMVREHTMALEELKQIAAPKHVWLPTQIDAKHKQAWMTLSRLKGASFDKAYRAMMIKGHQTVLGVVRTELRNGRDVMVRQYATTLEPAVKMHLKMAMNRSSIMHHG